MGRHNDALKPRADHNSINNGPRCATHTRRTHTTDRPWTPTWHAVTRDTENRGPRPPCNAHQKKRNARATHAPSTRACTIKATHPSANRAQPMPANAHRTHARYDRQLVSPKTANPPRDAPPNTPIDAHASAERSNHRHPRWQSTRRALLRSHACAPHHAQERSRAQKHANARPETSPPCADSARNDHRVPRRPRKQGLPAITHLKSPAQDAALADD